MTDKSAVNCRGKVYLVGAGPGDPLLVTLKGANLLEEAEVVVYDRLVSEEILSFCGERARLVYVGKEPGGRSVSQEEINDLLYREAAAGRMVVRLKGGDPLLFGRGGEEMGYLLGKGIPVEVVPGITSALAVPAYAGIPITYRGVSRSVVLATGRTRHGDERHVDWEGIARSCDTLVVLMGRENLETIVSRLLAGGMDPERPAAAIQYGATRFQKTAVSTIRELEKVVREEDIRAPMVLVIGEVVALRESMAWWERKALFEKRVLILRAAGQERRLSRRLQGMGARVTHVPAIHVRENKDPGVARALEGLPGYRWVVFTSPNAATFLFRALGDRGKDARCFHGACVVALGPGTERALWGFGLRADLVPQVHSTQGLEDLLGMRDLRGDGFLLVRSSLASPDLRRFLEGRGASVREIHPYRVEWAGESDAGLIRNLREENIDVILLTSPSAAMGLMNLAGGDAALVSRAVVGCIGPVTAEAATDLGLRVDFTAENHSEEGLVEALVRFLEVSRSG